MTEAMSVAAGNFTSGFSSPALAVTHPIRSDVAMQKRMRFILGSSFNVTAQATASERRRCHDRYHRGRCLRPFCLAFILEDIGAGNYFSGSSIRLGQTSLVATINSLPPPLVAAFAPSLRSQRPSFNRFHDCLAPLESIACCSSKTSISFAVRTTFKDSTAFLSRLFRAAMKSAESVTRT